MKNNGFTLAELMITLGIIGVVAVILINTTNAILSKVHERSRKVAEAKFKQVMKTLNAKDLLHGISTTEEFADILQQHIKVIKRCNADNLTNCFAKTVTRNTAKVLGNTSGLKKEDISKIKKGENLGFPANISENVGFVLADGITLIFSYDTSCESNPYDNMNASEHCFIAMYDINGLGNPNKLNEDVGLFNASLGPESCIDIDGLCVTVSDISYSPTNAEPFTGMATEANGNCSRYNYWDGAKQACEEIGMHLPNSEEISKIAFNSDKLGLSDDYYWSNISTDIFATLYSKGGIWGDFSKGCVHHTYLVRCVK